MSLKFSDQIGVTKVPNVLQIDGVSAALRNSLWNYLLKNYIFWRFDIPYKASEDNL